MEKAITVRGMEIGAGTAKIAVSLTGAAQETLIEKAKSLCTAGGDSPDIIEWRIDAFHECMHPDAVLRCLEGLRQCLDSTPLLATFRTVEEGGFCESTEDAYRTLNEEVAASGLADFIDIEMHVGASHIERLCGIAHAHNTRVVLSHHNLGKTPSEEEMLLRLDTMAKFGADIAKLAVMAHTPYDTGRLLNVSLTARKTLPCPFITIAMGGHGRVSRLWNAVSGSCITFAAQGTESAPGQLPLSDVRHILRLLGPCTPDAS